MPVEIVFSNSALPSIEVTCDGTPLALMAQLIELEASSYLDGTGAATLRFATKPGDSDPASPFEATSLGSSLTIALGSGAVVQPIFTGTIGAQRIRVSGAGLPELVLEAGATLTAQVTEDEASIFVARYGVSLLELDARRSSDEEPSLGPSSLQTSLNGYARVPGTTVAKPGALFCIEGIGTPFEGNVRIVAVHQSINVSGWMTRIDF